MICVEDYISRLLQVLHKKFAHRLVYMGLQGSYLRGEATENSDIDIMVVIDGLTPSDLRIYREVIESLGESDRSCGFICSKADMASWNPLEICHLIHTTKDYFGYLRELVPAYTEQDIRNFVKMSINNLYHEICHRYIHGDEDANVSCLPITYKGVFFILQNIHYLRTGEFIGTKQELLVHLRGNDRAVLEQSMIRDLDWDFQDSFDLLFYWCQESLQNL